MVSGGGILNRGDLNVTDSVITGNRAGRGGGIYSRGVCSWSLIVRFRITP